MFTGYHPIIHFVGARGARSSAWKAIAGEIAHMPTHVMFEACWDWLTATEKPKVVAKVATELGAVYSERLASLLLARKRQTSGEFMLEVWDALFELPVSNEAKSDWIARMAAIAPNALNSLEECESWIPASHREEFLSHFKEDIGIGKLLHTLHRALHDTPISKELSSPIVEIIRNLIEKKPPRHWSTYDVVQSFLRSLDIDDEPLTKEIKARRSEGIEAAHKRPEGVVPKLEQWKGRS